MLAPSPDGEVTAGGGLGRWIPQKGREGFTGSRVHEGVPDVWSCIVEVARAAQ